MLDMIEQHYQLIQHWDNQAKVALVERLQQDIRQNPNDEFAQYDKLSRLTARPNVIIGNSDDLVNVSWEKELNLDFPN